MLILSILFFFLTNHFQTVCAHEFFLFDVDSILHELFSILSYVLSNSFKHFNNENYCEHVNDQFEIWSLFSTIDRAESLNIDYSVHQSCWLLLYHWAQFQGMKIFLSTRNLSFLYQLHYLILNDMNHDWAEDYDNFFDMIDMTWHSVHCKYTDHKCLDQFSTSAVHDATFDFFHVNSVVQLMKTV